MADIAFLLLIFFLVTASILKDYGINRKLPPPCPEGQDCSGTKVENNILRISINNRNEIMLGVEIISIEELKNETIKFLDNNGDGTCEYCICEKLKNLSNNPKEAVISPNKDNLTSYSQYVKVQYELTKAYFKLRAEYCRNILKKSVDQLTKKELQEVKDAYPFIL